ncbi:MAG TPA: hypothetical protein VIY52_25545 [Streptosporangiaceae bacterium]
MNFKELAELVPWLITEKIDDASAAVPLVGGAVHEETPMWAFSTGSALTLAAVFPRTNELRLTSGLAINLPYTAELSRYVNDLNAKQLTFGRAFLVDHLDPARAAVLMQEIVFGDGLAWDFPPSIQNLLRIIGTLTGQAARLAAEIIPRFDARPLNDAEVGLLMVYC